LNFWTQLFIRCWFSFLVAVKDLLSAISCCHVSYDSSGVRGHSCQRIVRGHCFNRNLVFLESLGTSKKESSNTIGSSYWNWRPTALVLYCKPMILFWWVVNLDYCVVPQTLD